MPNKPKEKDTKMIIKEIDNSALAKFHLSFEYDRTWSDAKTSSRNNSK